MRSLTLALFALVVATLPVDAFAGPPDAALLARVSSCVGFSDLLGKEGSDGPARSIKAVGLGAFLIKGTAGRWLALRSGDECALYDMAAPAAGLRGVFQLQSGKTRVLILREGACDSCGAALTFWERGRLSLVGFTPEPCSMGVSASAVHLFTPRQSSIQLECRQGQGGEDWHAKALLMHVIGGRLKTLLAAHTSVHSAGPEGTPGSTRICHHDWLGELKIVRTGTLPEVTVAQTDRDAPAEGKGRLTTWVFDPVKKVFKRQGKDKPYTYEAAVRCERGR